MPASDMCGRPRKLVSSGTLISSESFSHSDANKSNMRLRRGLSNLAHGLLVLLVVFGSLQWGYRYRQWIWNQTQGVHFFNSLDNAILWGHYTNQVGVVDVYQKLVKEYGDEGRYNGAGTLPLDYPPLRLLIMSHWEAWTARHFAPPQNRRYAWRPQYEFTLPMLVFNTGCELAAAVIMFLLVHYWLRRCAGVPGWPWVQPVRGVWPAMVAALVVWFNPAAVFNSHGYVQWDVWIFAPFLLAVYLGLLDQWLLAGICIGAVALGKGQVLIVAPVLAIWQLFTLRRGAVPYVAFFGCIVLSLWIISNDFLPLLWVYLGIGSALVAMLFYLLLPWTPWRLLLGMIFGFEIFKSMLVAVTDPFSDQWILILAAPIFIAWMTLTASPASVIRFGIGIALAIGCVASPWLVCSDVSTAWIITVLIALQLLVSLCFNRSGTKIAIIFQGVAIAIAAQLVLWPWIRSDGPGHFWTSVLILIGFVAAARFLPRRWAPTWFCGGVAAALFACVPLFNTSMAWYEIGIKFGTRNREILTWMDPTNLGKILEESYHWHWAEQLDLAAYLPWLGEPYEIPMRYLMIAAYLISMVLCGFGMAMHQRRRSPQFFFAMAAPWILMFALMPQMDNRYLIWGAVLSAAAAAFSLRGLLMCFALSMITIVDTALDMMSPRFAGDAPVAVKWYPRLVPFFPGLSWAVLVLAAIWLYLSVKPARRGAVAGPS